MSDQLIVVVAAVHSCRMPCAKVAEWQLVSGSKAIEASGGLQIKETAGSCCTAAMQRTSP
jgi:hypothetical protein